MKSQEIINSEIKAKCKNHDKIRQYLQSHKADFKGTDHQIDTYFNVPSGRLKLRQGSIENNLIFYERKDQDGPKQSSINLAPAGDSSALRNVLTSALGVKVVVDKTREIYFIDNVKFHIDTVEQLGTFMEIEAIDWDRTHSVRELQDQCAFYMSEMGISKDDLVTGSYSDLLLKI